LFDRRFDPRALVIPRRDGKSGDFLPAVELAVDAVSGFERAFAKADRTVSLVLSQPLTDDDLAAAMREAESGDLSAMTPQQAAIAAATVLYDAPKNYEPYVLVDAWVAARGVPFAVAATIELGGFGIWIVRKGLKAPALCREDNDAFSAQERFAMAARMRRHLAAAGAEDYAAALDAAGSLRSSDHLRNSVASFLFPESDDWVEQDIVRSVGRRWEAQVRDGLTAWLLIGSVSTPRQAERLAKWVHADALRLCGPATATMVATVGLDIIPVVANWVEDYWDGVEARQRVQRMLAGFDRDEAFLALLGQLSYRGTSAVLAEAAQRFPERGVRLLAEAAPDQPAERAAVERVLRLTVTSRPEAARAVAPLLADGPRAHVEKLVNAVAAPLPSVAAGMLPDLLTTPPWEQARETVKPIVVKDLEAPASAEVVWLSEQEREDWLADRLGEIPDPERQDWDKRLAKALGRRNAYQLMVIVVKGPETQARRALRNLVDGYSYDALEWCTTATARFGLDAFPATMSAVHNNPVANAELLLPYACSEIAPLVAEWNLRLKTLRAPAQAWMRRHPALTARTLIPAALGRAGRTRQAAEAALRFLAAPGFRDEVLAEAAVYGTGAEAGVVQLLTQDPLSAGLPKTMPEVPGWAEPESLPQLLVTQHLVAGRKEALPAQAVRNVVRMLMISTRAWRP
jgi:hypothetical protein